jgi:hypothetical protein
MCRIGVETNGSLIIGGAKGELRVGLLLLLLLGLLLVI